MKKTKQLSYVSYLSYVLGPNFSIRKMCAPYVQRKCACLMCVYVFSHVLTKKIGQIGHIGQLY